MKKIENKNIRVKMADIISDYISTFYPGFKLERFRIENDKSLHVLIDLYQTYNLKEEEN